jgi:hypothetical protein
LPGAAFDHARVVRAANSRRRDRWYVDALRTNAAIISPSDVAYPDERHVGDAEPEAVTSRSSLVIGRPCRAIWQESVTSAAAVWPSGEGLVEVDRQDGGDGGDGDGSPRPMALVEQASERPIRNPRHAPSSVVATTSMRFRTTRVARRSTVERHARFPPQDDCRERCIEAVVSAAPVGNA